MSSENTSGLPAHRVGPTMVGETGAQELEHGSSFSTSVRMGARRPKVATELEELASESVSLLHQSHLRGEIPATANKSSLNTDEVEELFRYMEEHTSRVEMELRRILSEDEEEEAVTSAEKRQIERSVRPDSNSTDLVIHEDHFGIGADFVNVREERRHYKLASNRLHKLEHDIQMLLRHLESEFTKLELRELSTGTGDAARMQHYQHQLERCQAEVRSHIHILREKNDFLMDGVGQSGKYFPENLVNIEVRKSPVEWLTWLHGFLFLTVFLTICFMYVWSGTSDEWTVHLRLVRSPLLILLLLYLYGINMKVWALFKIDYVTIFGHPPDATPTPRYIFRVASILTILMSLVSAGVIVSSAFSSRIPIKVLPLIMWLLLIVFILNPFNVLLRKARYHFLLAFMRVLLSPFFFVYFSDFFLADQFNSSVAIFLDIQYLVCYVASHPWTGNLDTGKCTFSTNGIRPVISVLPALWRLLQCLRAFYDTRRVKHLVNAGKYFTTFPLVILATLFAVKEKEDVPQYFDFDDAGWILICWVIVAFINSVYTFLWDVVYDWGLWNFKSLRKLVYRSKTVYVLAVGFDFILRCFWTLKLTLALVSETHSDLIFTGM